ncbi:flagellar protein FliS [Alphaproteobacteria bacterium]|jgi:flagellar protein FliS|nr:flagellar protein FliS [Alphaproteobacteria bacterium]MDA9959030.1 flagellar protein FliS [Alphaproteobacteria bacterium]MDB3896102.1 flagellar protein FliS [Alphaproteobacteria bacterium]MDC1037395.1 flagellar protein FliS [Alphaproteobacteria bacterium]
MSQKYKKMTDVYQSTERNALAETEDPHKLVLIMFDALIKSMEIYIENIDIKTADLELRSKHFSRSLTIIYSLQSSLDFEKGGEIAANLFQTYEFARQMVIGSIKDMDSDGPKRAVSLLADIREAWAQMGEKLTNEK